MVRLGVRLDAIPQLTIEDMLDLALIAEERGYESAWVPEGGGRDSLTQLTAFAMATRRIHLGTGILPVFSRTPTLTAMSAVGLDMISNHRFILGLGVGHQGSVEGSHGIDFKNPFTRIKETVTIVRRLLRGEHVSYQGRLFKVAKATLGYAQEFPVPLYLAALGPQMIELAGEVADGVLLNWASPTYLEEALGYLRRGADRAGRRVEEIDVACYIRVAVVADDDVVHGPLRRQLLRYIGMDYYRNFFLRTGFMEEIQAIDRHIARGDHDKAAGAITEEMQRQMAVFGPPEFCRQAIERRRKMGLKLPIIAPFAVGGAKNSYRATIEAFEG